MNSFAIFSSVIVVLAACAAADPEPGCPDGGVLSVSDCRCYYESEPGDMVRRCKMCHTRYSY